MNKKMALITRYGYEKNAKATAVVVAIVNKNKKKLLDELTDIITMYVEKNNAGPIELSDGLRPVEELEKKCPKCGESIVRVPW